MLKYLLVISVISFVYYFFIKKKPLNSQTPKSSKVNTDSSDMVKCQECGIYCAVDDTILSANKYYCSKECMEKN